MTAPTLRYMDDPNATPKEKLKAAKALVRDGRVNEAAVFLEQAANQNAGQQLRSIGNLVRRGQVLRSFRALICLLRTERYRSEMLEMQATFDNFIRDERIERTRGGDDRAANRSTPVAMPIASPSSRFKNDRDATLKEKLKAGRALINDGRVSEALSILQGAAAQTSAEQLRVAGRLWRQGKVVRGVKAIECIVRFRKYRDAALKLRDVCRELTGLDQPQAAPKDEAADYRIKNVGSKVTVIAFTGLDRRFTVAVYFLERLLGKFGVNLIIVYDRHEAFYLAGIPGLGAGIEETCANLKRLCADMNTRHIVCLGQSSGGYGALRYAVELGADHVLAFSPSFIGVLDKNTRAEIARRTGRLFDEDAVDVRALYRSRKKTPRLTIVYGADNRYDERSAVALGAIRGTNVQALPGVSRHGTLSESVCQGLFFDLVTSAITSPGTGRA